MICITQQYYRNTVLFCNFFNNTNYRTGICINKNLYERNYFGMMMVETGDADAFITGLYTKYSNTIKVAKEVIGIRKE